MAPIHLQQQCHHVRDIPLSLTLIYCSALSSIFVLSLYAFVPPSVRRLPRDHVTHIQWRTGVIVGVMMVGVGVYPWLFCQRIMDSDSGEDDAGGGGPPWYRYLGFSWQPMQDLRIALHVLILYLGSLTCTWLKIYHYARILSWEKETEMTKKQKGKSSRIIPPEARMKLLPIIPKPKNIGTSIRHTWIQPTIHSFQSFYNDKDHRWTKIRNLGVAPLAEEVVFRACLLPPLLASRISKSSNSTTTTVTTTATIQSLSPTQVSWIAPLFFGVAHLHHFYEKWRTLPMYLRTKKVLVQLSLGVLVQWTYTTLFGAYVSHVFVRTGSLSGVTLAHIICNYMGLPEVSFVHPESNLYGYRWLVMMMYFLGIGFFIRGFDSAFLFPGESVLPSLLQWDQ